MSEPNGKKYRKADNRWQSLSIQIETHAALLVDQGDLVLKKVGTNRYWYLRYLLSADEKGRRRHCSLYVGREFDVELVAQVRALLEQLRAPRRCLEEITGCVQVAEMLTRLMLASDVLASTRR